MTRLVKLLLSAVSLLSAPLLPQLTLASELHTQGQANVDIVIVPTASIAIVGGSLLALTVPPSGSTVNTSGAVHFVVAGNAMATVTAAPSAFVEIPGQGWMGRAVLDSGVVGYQIQLTFPSTSATGSHIAIATLPLDVAEPTYPALSAPLPLTLGQRPGVVDLLASADWTPDGGLPLPGVYVGAITITVTADNL